MKIAPTSFISPGLHETFRNASAHRCEIWDQLLGLMALRVRADMMLTEGTSAVTNLGSMETLAREMVFPEHLVPASIVSSHTQAVLQALPGSDL